MTGGDEDVAIGIRVRPEPTDEEAAAIVAVVTALSASARPQEDEAPGRMDRWARAGRMESLRGLPGEVLAGPVEKGKV